MTYEHIESLVPDEIATATKTASLAGAIEAVAAESLRTGPQRDCDLQA